VHIDAGHRAAAAARNPADRATFRPTNRCTDDPAHRDDTVHATADLQQHRPVRLARGVQIMPAAYSEDRDPPNARAIILIAAYRAGASLRQLARTHGVGVSTVHTILRRHGEPRRRPGDHPRPPTAAQLERERAIREAYAAGLSMHRVARELGLSASLVWKVLHRHRANMHAVDTDDAGSGLTPRAPQSA
jgi:transposase-like protein